MSVSTDAIQQLDGLIASYTPKLASMTGGRNYISGTTVEMAAALSRLLAGIERLSGAGSTYRADARRIIDSEAAAGVQAAVLLGIAEAMRDDYKAGYFRSVEELVHASLFGDFLGMAQELLDKGYKDPSAVLTGSVLEEHLRKLADKSGVRVTNSAGKPIKADTMNADLAKQRVYNLVQQQAVTAWLALRNKAAHGEYDEYDKGQVASMIADVRSFLTQYPA